MRGTVDDKVLARVAGRPVFAHSAAAFMASGVADLYVIAYRDRRQMLALSASAPTPCLLVPGGRERQDSVMNALAALPGDIRQVFIHDCARPLILPEQLVALHKMVHRKHAVTLAHRICDTVRESRGRARMRTLDRSRLWAIETPQVFDRDLIVRAYTRVRDRGIAVTDDAGAVELLGKSVALLENLHPNPKITTPADLEYVAWLLERRFAACPVPDFA
jgi:2-C-methyl-D-erythritol 4-phosphate cytidylyltransferase